MAGGGGGGGAALGGAVFVREGGRLTIADPTFGATYSVTGGVGGTGTSAGGAGQAKGSFAFLHGTGEFVFDLANYRSFETTDGIAGTGTLVKKGAAELQLTKANSDFTGAIKVEEGTLHARFANALGTTDGGVTVTAGASLKITQVGGVGNGYGTDIGAEAVSLAGTGVGGVGALVNGFGTNSLAGAITLTGDAAFGAIQDKLTLSGVVSGAFNLTKVGTGTIVLSGTSTYSGTTTVSAGTLAVDGTIVSAVTVANGGTLGGTGTVAAVTVQSGGKLAAGNSPGVINTGNLNLQAGSTLAAEIAGTAGGQFDKVNVAGTVTLTGSSLNLSLLNGFAPTIGDEFTIIANDNADAVTGTFTGLAEGATVKTGSSHFKISYVGGDGNDVVLTAIAAPTASTGDTGAPAQTPWVYTWASGGLGVDPSSAKAASPTLTLAGGAVIANPAHQIAQQVHAVQSQLAAGQITNTQALAQLAPLADATTGVAHMSYNFFTGAPPSAAGMIWLVNSTDNANDLTDPYYAMFSTENRFINFAVNLGRDGAGREGFEAAYGQLSFAEAAREIYDDVIGLALARIVGINVEGALAYIVSQQAYFQALGGQGLGAKAAMAGYILSVAAQADLGAYHQASHTYVVSQINLAGIGAELDSGLV